VYGSRYGPEIGAAQHNMAADVETVTNRTRECAAAADAAAVTVTGVCCGWPPPPAATQSPPLHGTNASAMQSAANHRASATLEAQSVLLSQRVNADVRRC